MFSRIKFIVFVFLLGIFITVSFQMEVSADGIDGNQSEISSNETIYGYALKQPVHFYSSPSKSSTILKSYQYNHRLKFRPYSVDWYSATVYLNGIAYKAYVHKNDVGKFSEASTVRGIAKTKVNVFQKTNRNSRVWKSYNKGRILKYSSYNKDWYIATVKVNNKWQKGFIHASDVATAKSNQKTLHGIGKKSSTKVYAYASKNSKSLKGYPAGKVLKYRTFTKDWYEATVYLNGRKHTGYIATNDVEEVSEKQQTLHGIGINQPTKVFSIASKKSKSLKSYPAGKILKYRTFTKDWYEATVYLKGKKHTGYIASNDVEQINQSRATSLTGIATNQRTTVYSLASKGSKALKGYRFGHHLKFKTFSKHWYQATVYINGKPKTGYIFKNDVQTDLNAALKGYALKNTTNVYQKTSKKSNTLKSYKKGHLLKFKPYNNQWFKATVYVNGVAKSGYISTKDVSPHAPNLKAKALKNKTNVYSKSSRGSKVLKNYKKGKTLKFKPYSNNWYIATVFIKGIPKTGYIHVNDVGDLPNKPEPPIVENNDGDNVPILMYHQIGNEPSTDAYGRFVTEDNFKEQINHLRENGYTLLHFDELDDIDKFEKPIIVTFDDGYANNEIAYNVLEDLNDETFQSKATFFIIPNKFGDDKYLSEEQVKMMSDSGIISIQSHTMTHVHFNNEVIVDGIDLNYQLYEAKQILENITGKNVHTLAYPYGAYNDLVIEDTKKHYDYAVTTRHDIANINEPYELNRVRISFDTTLTQFENLISH